MCRFPQPLAVSGNVAFQNSTGAVCVDEWQAGLFALFAAAWFRVDSITLDCQQDLFS